MRQAYDYWQDQPGSSRKRSPPSAARPRTGGLDNETEVRLARCNGHSTRRTATCPGNGTGKRAGVLTERESESHDSRWRGDENAGDASSWRQASAGSVWSLIPTRPTVANTLPYTFSHPGAFPAVPWAYNRLRKKSAEAEESRTGAKLSFPGKLEHSLDLCTSNGSSLPPSPFVAFRVKKHREVRTGLHIAALRTTLWASLPEPRSAIFPY